MGRRIDDYNMQHAWTQPQMDTVLALLCKKVSVDDHWGMATKLNQALNGKTEGFNYDIPHEEVQKLLAYIKNERKHALDLIERQPRPHVITRSIKLAFARELAFDGSKTEWVVGGRREAEAAAWPGRVARMRKRLFDEKMRRDSEQDRLRLQKLVDLGASVAEQSRARAQQDYAIGGGGDDDRDYGYVLGGGVGDKEQPQPLHPRRREDQWAIWASAADVDRDLGVDRVDKAARAAKTGRTAEAINGVAKDMSSRNGTAPATDAMPSDHDTALARDNVPYDPGSALVPDAMDYDYSPASSPGAASSVTYHEIDDMPLMRSLDQESEATGRDPY